MRLRGFGEVMTYVPVPDDIKAYYEKAYASRENEPIRGLVRSGVVRTGTKTQGPVERNVTPTSFPDIVPAMTAVVAEIGPYASPNAKALYHVAMTVAIATPTQLNLNALLQRYDEVIASTAIMSKVPLLESTPVRVGIVLLVAAGGYYLYRRSR